VVLKIIESYGCDAYQSVNTARAEHAYPVSLQPVLKASNSNPTQPAALLEGIGTPCTGDGVKYGIVVALCSEPTGHSSPTPLLTDKFCGDEW